MQNSVSALFTKHKNPNPGCPKGSSVSTLTPSTPQGQILSGSQAAAAAVLDPGGHKKAGEGDRDQAEHDAAEEGFDH